MRNKNSKQTKNNDSFKLSDEYSKNNNSNNDGRALDERLQNLKLEHESQINDIITKNKKLLAILAHDIRSPMGLIVGHLRLLKNRIRNHDENTIKVGIENVLKSAEKFLTLLENLLNWATTENNMEKIQQEYVEISIKDNGIGIKDKVQKLLFTDKSSDLNLTKVNEPGHGFGLVFCKEIIDLHRGEISVSSEQGKGSEFKFTLPLGPV